MSTFKIVLSVGACAGLILYLQACSPVPYANVGLNVPMLKEKGEVNLNASYGTTEDAAGIALQAAAAVGSSVSVMASFYYLNAPSSEYWKGNGNYVELGVGKFGRVSSDGKFICDAYLGLGSAGIKSEFENDRVDVKFLKPFLQGSIGFNHKVIDVALTTRFAVVHFTEHEFRFDDPAYTLEAAKFFQENQDKFVFEPGITVRVGYEAVRLSLQFSITTFSQPETANGHINDEYFGIGLNALIGKRWVD